MLMLGLPPERIRTVQILRVSRLEQKSADQESISS
jgi:hypothetical protein